MEYNACARSPLNLEINCELWNADSNDWSNFQGMEAIFVDDEDRIFLMLDINGLEFWVDLPNNSESRESSTGSGIAD